MAITGTRIWVFGFVVLASLIAARAHATVADDICAPAADPCIVSTGVAVTDGSILNFGARALVITPTGGLLVPDDGSVSIIAGSVEIQANGRIVARRGNVDLNITGTLVVLAGAQRGRIDVSDPGPDVNGFAGNVDATVGGTVTIGGDIRANGPGLGGRVDISSGTAIVVSSGGLIDANSSADAAGSVFLESNGPITINGTVRAQGLLDGFISGTAVGTISLAGTLDASGSEQGGVVELETDTDLLVAASGVIRVNGGILGGGGETFLFACDELNLADGSQLLATGENGENEFTAGGPMTIGGVVTAGFRNELNWVTSPPNLTGSSINPAPVVFQVADVCTTTTTTTSTSTTEPTPTSSTSSSTLVEPTTSTATTSSSTSTAPEPTTSTTAPPVPTSSTSTSVVPSTTSSSTSTSVLPSTTSSSTSTSVLPSTTSSSTSTSVLPTTTSSSTSTSAPQVSTTTSSTSSSAPITSTSTSTAPPTTTTLPSGCDPARPETCVRNFQCFELKRGLGPFPPDVTVTDRFGSRLVSLQVPDRLCAPANVRDGDASAPGDPEHLVSHGVLGRPTVAVRALRVDNALGVSVLDTTRMLRVLVPTAKSLTAPPAPLVAPATDHFACYKVRPARGFGTSARFRAIRGVAVQDQFGARVVDVLKPVALCAPADKSGENPAAAGHAAHLVCYRTRHSGPRPGAIAPIFIANQFGDSIVAALRTQELCIPSLITPTMP
jgi:hypothetical protein